MEVCKVDIDPGHLSIGHGDALGIATCVELAADRQARFGCRGANQIDDDAIADQRLGTPVHADEREQAVLYLVPLAGSGRQVVDIDLDAEFVGQALQLTLPQARARGVAAAAVRGDRQVSGVRIPGGADVLPPAADGLHGEGRRVMVHAHADPSGIGREVIDAVRHRPAQFLDEEVMHPDRFGLALRAPLPAAVLEVSDKLLLLRVDRDHRLTRRQRSARAPIDVFELRVAVRMVVALAGLAIGRQAEIASLSPALRLIGTPRKRTISARAVGYGQGQEGWNAQGTGEELRCYKLRRIDYFTDLNPI